MSSWWHRFRHGHFPVPWKVSFWNGEPVFATVCKTCLIDAYREGQRPWGSGF